MRGRGARRRPMRAKAPKDPSRLKIDSILSSSLTAIGLDIRLREYTLKKTWADCVGKAVAKRSAPIRLIGSTLWCAVSSAPWMTELNFHKQSIIEKLNDRLGKGSVTEIIFRPGKVAEPHEPPPVEVKPPRLLTDDERRFIAATAEPVKDETLKKLIKRLMEKSMSMD
ncbi:MAG: DUF721 domain-containing protein [Thermodesulfobacteriota bacterium]|nr:MAG: DUF721 domain-containing protein [Thermodesulfobacteriota bacterium]